MIWRALLIGVGAWGLAPAVGVQTHRWINLALGRFERLLVRYRAGKLRVGTKRVVTAGRKILNQPAVRLPRRWAWLVLAGKHHAACYGGQLQYSVLNTPEIAALLEESPQARRILRPLLRALAVELPWTVNQSRRARKPRAKKLRPVHPQDANIRWERGEKTWNRKQKRLERALKLKAELILKMAQGRGS